MAEDNTPTNVVDEGGELYHSISKGEKPSRIFTQELIMQLPIELVSFMVGNIYIK